MLILVLVLAGCGHDGSDDMAARTTSINPTASTQSVPAPPPAGPVVRICDRDFRAASTAVLRNQGFRGRLSDPPGPSGTRQLSVCDLQGRGGEVSVSLDAASGAVRRYHNRVTETAQFSGGDPEHAPHTVKGVGDARLGGAGANWLPRIHLLLSARGDRVLIVDVSADGLGDDALRDAAIHISLDAYERLGS